MAEDKGKTTDSTDSSADNATTNPEETVEGQSFYNPALTGSGTITTDGTYAEPLPDPTQVRGLGPERTSGGRRVLGGLGDPDAARVREVTENVTGTAPEDTWRTDSRNKPEGDSSPDASDSDENRTAKRGGRTAGR